jgi:uncharacterized damage-inducible protein DinB
MPGWGKLVAGAVIGAAGTLYATNEEFRRRLPETLQDLPATVRGRFEAAAAAAREASSKRRAEILRSLEAHEEARVTTATAPDVAPPPESAPDEDATQPIPHLRDGERP